MEKPTICAVFPITLLFLITFSPLAGADKRLIEKTCKSTKDYKLCLSSLNSNSTSSTADVKGLAVIMIGIGMDNANATATYLTSQVAAAKNKDAAAALRKEALEDCVNMYTYAGNNLLMAVEDMDMGDYNYAPIHVAGAANCIQWCRDAFRRTQGRVVYPPELARRANGLRRICQVILQINRLLIAK